MIIPIIARLVFCVTTFYIDSWLGCPKIAVAVRVQKPSVVPSGFVGYLVSYCILSFLPPRWSWSVNDYQLDSDCDNALAINIIKLRPYRDHGEVILSSTFLFEVFPRNSNFVVLLLQFFRLKKRDFHRLFYDSHQLCILNSIVVLVTSSCTS